MKNAVLTAVGAVGSTVMGLFGGWNSALTALCVFMTVDYITGLILAGVFKKSKKSADGSLESKAGFKGLFKKCVILLLVLVGNQLDLLIGSTYIRDGICIAFSANEVLSITENAGLMGIPLPKVLIKAIAILKTDDSEKQESTDSESKKDDKLAG